MGRAKCARIHEEIEGAFGRRTWCSTFRTIRYQPLPDAGAIIRKGSVHLRPGQLSVFPHVRRRGPRHGYSEGRGHSLVHESRDGPQDVSRRLQAAGRRVRLRGLAKVHPASTGVEDASLRTEGPYRVPASNSSRATSRKSALRGRRVYGTPVGSAPMANPPLPL